MKFQVSDTHTTHTICIIQQEIRSMERVSAQCVLFKVIQGQNSWCQSIAHRWFPIRVPLIQSLQAYLSLFSQNLTCNFDDLEVGQFKVTQDQST